MYFLLYLPIGPIHENIAIIISISHSSIPFPQQLSSSPQCSSPPHRLTPPSVPSLQSTSFFVLHTKHRSTIMFSKPWNHMKMCMRNNLSSTHPFPSTHTFPGGTIILYNIEPIRARNFDYSTRYDG